MSETVTDLDTRRNAVVKALTQKMRRESPHRWHQESFVPWLESHLTELWDAGYLAGHNDGAQAAGFRRDGGG